MCPRLNKMKPLGTAEIIDFLIREEFTNTRTLDINPEYGR